MIHVVAAVIRDQQQILLSRRPDHLHQGGLWEFPGGKQEPGETPEQALRRELAEELGIQVTRYRPLIQVPHHYPDLSVLLDVWEVDAWEGEVSGLEGQTTSWVAEHELKQYQFPEANLPIIKACQLPSRYLITPSLKVPESQFLSQLEAAVERGITLVQFRQHELSSSAFENLACKAIEICHNGGSRLLLNGSAEQVKRLGADGLQLNARDLMTATVRPLPEPYLVAASCHNQEELDRAGELGLDFAVLSPVQATATHPDATPLGWGRFRQLVSSAVLPVYALGGVNQANIAVARENGGQGISAIRGLWQPAEH